jgi:sodium-independent sulfate anion transporter 11
MNKLPEKGLFIVSKAVWFVCTARNALVVVVCAVMAGFMDADGDGPFTLTGKIEAGIPNAQLPPFSIPANVSNATGHWNQEIPFSEMVSQLGSAIIVIPIIAILESVAIAKAFCKFLFPCCPNHITFITAGGKPVDASQEMVALGFCNILGSFVQSMPTTGSFSRTAVNSASGVKTPLGGIFTGGLVILCLAFLMPYCAFIPKATLSAVIMTAVIFSVEYAVVKPLWGSKSK